MLGYLALLVVLLACLIVAASFRRLARTKALTTSDVGIFIGPILLWLVLSIVGWRTKSLSNLVDPVVLFVLLSMCLGARTYLPRQGSNAQVARWALLLGLAFSVLVYALTPILPE